MRKHHLAAIAIAISFAGCGDTELDSDSEAIVLTTNYALGKPATQSSTGYGGTPDHAVDGNTSGVWANNSVSHTNLESHPWWQVDLLQGRVINVINVFGRTDPCCTSRLSNYYVMISLQPFASNDLATNLANPNVHYQFVSGTSPLPSVTLPFYNQLGRYVRVQLAGSDYLSLAEVQVLDAPNTIPGPDAIATHTTWVPTGVTTSSAGFALAEVSDSLRSYQRGANGNLQESIDLGAPHDVPGSVAITTDAVSAVTDPTSGHTFVVARAAGNQLVVADYAATTTGTWTWSVLLGTDGPPAVAVACNNVYAALRTGNELDVYSRSIAGTNWNLAASYFGVRSPPALAASAGGDLGVAWVGTDNWIRFARATCATGGFPGGATTPGGTSFASGKVGLGALGNLFAVAVLGTDGKPYVAMQRPNTAGTPTWAGFDAVTPAQTIVEAPTVQVFRGLIFIAARDASNQMRYWIRDPNRFVAKSGYNLWSGGTIVSGYGTGATPPAFSTRGLRRLSDNYGYSETVPSELYVATKGIGDQQLYALNFGRFATWDTIAGSYGVSFNTKFEGNDVDPRTVPNFPDWLYGFFQIPVKDRYYTSHPYQCGGSVPLTILLSTNYVSGWSMMSCGVYNAADGRSFNMPASLLGASTYPSWTYWEELGHQMQNAVPSFKSQTGYSQTFGNLFPVPCGTNADCGAGATCDFGCIPGTRCPSGSEQFTSRKVCQAPGFGFSHIRPTGFVDWYDVTQDEHSFLNFVEWYRWWGDELRQMRDADVSDGSTLLRDKYNWVKANYYDGVEFHGQHANMSSGSRDTGAYALPMQ